MMRESRSLYILALTTFLALIVVWESAAIRRKGYALEQINAHLKREQALQGIYRAQITKLSSPRRILRLVKRLELNLVQSPQAPPPLAGQDARAVEGQSGIAALAETLSDAARPDSFAPIARRGSAEER